MKPYYKKKYQEKLKNSFTKTFDQIYAQYSKTEKIGYWIIVISVTCFIASVWIFGAWWR